MGARNRAMMAALILASGVLGGLVGARYAPGRPALAMTSESLRRAEERIREHDTIRGGWTASDVGRAEFFRPGAQTAASSATRALADRAMEGIDPAALAKSAYEQTLERARRVRAGLDIPTSEEESARLDALDWSDPAVRLENLHAGIHRQGRLAAKLYREGKLSREKAEQIAERLELLATIRGVGIAAGSR